MSDLATPRSWAARDTAEAVTVPQRHLLLLALLMCVPLPLLSVVATVVPLPEIVERAAANMVPFAEPPLPDGKTPTVTHPSRSKRAEITAAGQSAATPTLTSGETSPGKAASRKAVAARAQDAAQPTTAVTNRTTSDADPAPNSTASDAPAAAASADSTTELSPATEANGKQKGSSSQATQQESPSGHEPEGSSGNKPAEPPGQDRSGETGGTKKHGGSYAGDNT